MDGALKPEARPIVEQEQSVPPSWEPFLRDIEEAATKIQRYTNELDFKAFVEHEMTYDAVLRNLEIIGEAVKGIPDQIRGRFPYMDWRRMASLRDLLAHACFALDDATCAWRIINHTAMASSQSPWQR
jgi:uncharacterized protein with HEPN domain